MKTLIALMLIAQLAGCATATPDYDRRFGAAVRSGLLAQTANPEAGRNPDQAAGLDGKAARETMLLYQNSFKSPPPAVNVINIGGNLGGGGN